MEQLAQAEYPEIATTIRNAGLAGAGGAGFPTYAKWERLDEVSHLMVNHQESEPNYFMDKWLGKHHATEFAELFDALLERALQSVVISAKEKDREEWMGPLEEATDATIYLPDDLPLAADEESGVVIAYTDDQYQYGMESVLLRIVAGEAMREELPMDLGWIVQNTETLFNLYRTLDEGEAMTWKYVHVDGNVPHHRFLEVPVGTPASRLLREAGRPPDEIGDDEILADGGPGWCFEIDRPPEEFGVTKRTNCLLVLDADTAEENTLGDDRINVLNAYDWSGDQEAEPSEVRPEAVRIPNITNPAFEGVVDPSQPVVEPGEAVSAGEIIAVPGEDGVSNLHHASVPGTVDAVVDGQVVLEAAPEAQPETELDHERMVYWTWCDQCGAYIPRPEWEHVGANAAYVCEDCR